MTLQPRRVPEGTEVSYTRPDSSQRVLVPAENGLITPEDALDASVLDSLGFEVVEQGETTAPVKGPKPAIVPTPPESTNPTPAPDAETTASLPERAPGGES